jgi:glycosyltransferase involved in cell wall biosynthesis
MKVIHLLPHVRNTGNGITNAVVDLSVAQARSGLSVIVASAEGEYRQELVARGVEFTSIDMTQWRNGARLLLAFRKVHRLLRANPLSIVHCHSIVALVLAYLAGADRLVVTVHNSWQRLTLLNLFLAKRVIVLAEADLQRFTRFSLARNKVHQVENGVLDSFRFDTSCDPLMLKRPAIVTVAGLFPRKGISDLISALELMKETAFLYVVGEGPQRAELEALANDRGVSNQVIFTGFKSMPLNYMSDCDIFSLASHSEPAGLVLVEARMMGAAVVATDVGGIPSMLKPSAGILVPPGSPAGLAAVFDRLLGDPGELAYLRHQSLDGLSYYSVDRVAAEVTSVYKTFLA